MAFMAAMARVPKDRKLSLQRDTAILRSLDLYVGKWAFSIEHEAIIQVAVSQKLRRSCS